MRFSLSIDRPAAEDASAGDRPPMPGVPADAPARAAAEAEELRLLGAQLARMRGMLFRYSQLFFGVIRTWALVCVGLLVLGWSDVLPAAVVPVPFLIPFAFLETGYLFFYTVFARRHAERLEGAINERLGREVLAAHRLEAAYFYPPDRPKVAAFSFGNPLGFTSAMTVGYAVGAAILWAAGLASTAAYVATLPEGGPAGLVVPGAIAWTIAIAAYLAWTFLSRRDEDRLLAALATAYLLPAEEPEGPVGRELSPGPGRPEPGPPGPGYPEPSP